MRVLVLGGDGFCGWPTSLYLSERGYDVTILDNLSRRKIDIDLEVGSLTPITAIGDRLRAWREVSGWEIGFIDLDLATEYDRLTSVLRELRPEDLSGNIVQSTQMAEAHIEFSGDGDTYLAPKMGIFQRLFLTVSTIWPGDWF